MIKIPLYKIKIKIEVLENLESVKRKYNYYIKKFKLDEKDDPEKFYEGMVIVNPNNTSQVILIYSKDSLSINTITHEVYHLTNLVLDTQGTQLNPNDDEHYAILNGYLNEEVFKYLKKKCLITL